MLRKCGSWETARLIEVTGTRDADSDGNSPLQCCDAGRAGFTKRTLWISAFENLNVHTYHLGILLRLEVLHF